MWGGGGVRVGAEILPYRYALHHITNLKFACIETESYQWPEMLPYMIVLIIQPT